MDCVVQNGNIAKIMIIGVGGGGGNAVESMIKAGIHGVTFLALNTDEQALSKVSAMKMPIGSKLTKGLGAGSNPEIGRKAAEESADDIAHQLEGVNLVFIAAGMGGGTGTGAAPVVARIAKEMGILTIAVVTKPFLFEGVRRMRNADEGIENLKKNVDALVIVQNEKLNREKNASIVDAFKKADEILLQGVRSITEIVVEGGRINLDLADVTFVMKDSGMAHMGIGNGSGKNKTIDAIRKAVFSPLLETTIEGASAIIINFRGGKDLGLEEVTTGVELVRQVVSKDAYVLFGICVDETMQDEVYVTLIATGFDIRKEERNKFFEPQKPVEHVEYANQIRHEQMLQQQSAFERAQQQKQEEEAHVEPARVEQIVEKKEEVAPVVNVSVDKDKHIPSFLRKLKK